MFKNIFFFSIGFILISLLGAYTIELVRINTAKKIGHSARFNTVVARTEFWNDELNADFDTLLADYNNDFEKLKKSAEWRVIDKDYKKANTKIEGRALIFTLTVSLIGIVLIFVRINKNEFGILNWIGIFLSFLFVRYLIVNTIELIFDFKWCVEADILEFYNLPIKQSMILFEIIGLSLAIWIFFQVPKVYRISFLLSGLIFGTISGLIWIRFAQYILP